MRPWREDPWRINACRALFAIGLAILVFVHPSALAPQLIATIAWFGSGLVLLWWRFQSSRRPATSQPPYGSSAESPSSLPWLVVGLVLLVVGAVWALTANGWALIPAAALAIAGLAVARLAGKGLRLRD
jgi:hypothetical protein